LLSSDITKRFVSVSAEKISYLDATNTATFTYYDALDFNTSASTAGFIDGNFVAYSYYYCDGTPGTSMSETLTYSHFFRAA